MEGQSYNYKIYASNGAGDGPTSPPIVGYAGEIPGVIRQDQLYIVKRSLTELSIAYDEPDNTGGHPILHYWIKVQSGNNFETETEPIDNGVFLTYDYSINQPGNEGKNFRFKVAAENLLGVGPYTIGIVLMAVNHPDAPTIAIDDLSRTLSSIGLKFAPGLSNGGSLITGYQLYRD